MMKLVETLFKDNYSYVEIYENEHLFENQYFMNGILIKMQKYVNKPLEYVKEDARKWCEGLVLLNG